MPSPVDVIVELGDSAVVAGRLWAHRRGTSESATFGYSTDYLARADSYALDPLLPLAQGQFQTPVGRPMFGAFTDCAPDRWGRRLINRDERNRAQAAGARQGSLAEIDYLLGVRDDLRQGALRFRDTATGAYLAASGDGIPYLIGLGPLLAAADHFERNEATTSEVRDLLRAGSSLGGARPKAHVLLPDGRVAIAKFPSAANDEWDVMRWEAVALDLAARSGITAPERELHAIGARNVLIVTRFDRDGAQRIGYASAMTMLEATDGDDRSYLDIADAIERESADAEADLRELWRRIAFSLLISNTDDHLRNHGFLRSSTAGWRLSPIFDVNPNPQPADHRLSTTIARGSTDTIETLLDVADLFRLDHEQARSTLSDVTEATSQWRQIAAKNGLDASAIDEMEPAFEHELAAAARDLTAAGTSSRPGKSNRRSPRDSA
jgi:serine/threonine-protein kinase HipA